MLREEWRGLTEFELKEWAEKNLPRIPTHDLDQVLNDLEEALREKEGEKGCPLPSKPKS